MAGTALRRRLTWRLAEVVANRPETPRAQRLSLRVDGWEGHLPGQHVDVRLTAPDGYQAQRSYSIASATSATSSTSATDGNALDLVVERLPDGEVSPYLTDVLVPGDEVELRGPIGGWFVWDPDRSDHGGHGGPLQLVAGGSGVAPFLAMLDHRARTAPDVPARLLYSARDLSDVIGRDRLAAHADAGVDVTLALTRSQPPGWDGLSGRVTPDALRAAVWPPSSRPLVYVCGPTAFVEAIADLLVAGGHDPAAIRTERFGGLEQP